MKSLKSKLILAISIFVIALLISAAVIQIREERKNITQDIFENAMSFAELTSESIINDYKLYLIPESFLYFNREIEQVFDKNPDISRIRIADYEGNLLYDSLTESDQQFIGKREVENDLLKKQLKSKNLSVKEKDQNNAIYYKKDENGNLNSIDFEENAVDGLFPGEKIEYIVNPADDQFAVIYDVTYQALESRIFASQIRIFIISVFGLSIGIILAIILGTAITRPIKELKKGAEILATGDLTHRVKVNTKDETKLLADSFNKMAADLQESTKALVYKERVGKELELAKEIQKSIIPKSIPRVSGIDISAGLIPAEEIGGDCYDFLSVDEHNMLFYLGDVTGHGVPSGIVVSIANALFYTFAGTKPMNEILADVNKVLKEKTVANMFITLVLLNWDQMNQKMTYVSAGHEQIIHYKASTGEVSLLPAGGLALGMIKDIQKTLKIRDIDLDRGDVLVLYSDGIPEAWQNDKLMYGMERFQKIVAEYGRFETALAIRNALLADVHMFRKGYKQMDDITTIVIKRK
ncbi:SpoIIE family protein phosphatase [Candidatus Peregrinibacteria bacterium]|nr:SpoIIE family protein phosphatase [Candidatus Peregrinibacteria bacterium]